METVTEWNKSKRKAFKIKKKRKQPINLEFLSLKCQYLDICLVVFHLFMLSAVKPPACNHIVFNTTNLFTPVAVKYCAYMAEGEEFLIFNAITSSVYYR